MKVRETLVDFAYFVVLIFLISYGLLLVVRGYLGLVLSGVGRPPTTRS